jgi:hypothetical protein
MDSLGGMTMATHVKVTISVPRELYEASSLRAKREGISQSELFVSALEKMLKARQRARVADSWDRAYSHPKTTDEAAARQSALASMKRLARGRS